MADLRGACADCAAFGELPVIPREQFDGQAGGSAPTSVHAPLFHKQRALEPDGAWPADGRGTFCAAFAVD
ncbi:hypothetical protein ACF1BP_23515 [Streptomyces sp. NPDC014735]|uniref:hypothetical protein n=1 Tax=Streptomyces sp. NPDC014735 TaxID=3364887 RepID=UPI0037010344